MEQGEAASSHFITGDAEPMKALLFARGRRDHFRCLGSAVRFRGGKIAYETLAMAVSGDLAYTVGIERGEMREAGRDELSPMALRVTLISRQENGTWKLIHRHADPITTVQAPESVIQQEISRQPSRTQRMDDRLSEVEVRRNRSRLLYLGTWTN